MRHFYKLIFLTFFVCSMNFVTNIDAKSDECVTVGGVITEASANNSCQTEPSGYGIVAYKLYLCTAAPTAPTIVSVTDLASCVIVFQEASGSSVTLSTGTSVNLGGTQSLPPPGLYTHGVMHMDNTFAITAKKEFAVAYNGQVEGNGVYCVTVDGAGSSGSGGDSNDRTTCGDATLTAGTYTESLTSFDNPFNATATANNVAGTGANITAYLIDTNEFLAVNDGDVDTLLGVVEFASAANITANTSNVEISFNVGEGMSVDGIGGAMFFGSGPFQATVSTN